MAAPMAMLAGVLGIVAAAELLRRYNSEQVARAEQRHPPTGEFIEVGNVRLHLVRRGAGVPVLLLHGAAGSLHDFDALLSPLSRRFDVIALDRPGHGYSQPMARTRSSAHTQARLLRDLVRQLRLERPIVVGYSWAAVLALACVDGYPDDFGAAVSIGGTTHVGTPPRNPLYWILRTPLASEALLALGLVPVGRPYVALPLRRAFHPDPLDVSHLQRSRDVLVRAAPARAMIEDFRTLPAALQELRPRYPSVHTPVIVLAGTEDRLVDTESNSMRLAAEAPGAELVLVPGAGHALPQTRPEAVVEAIVRAAERRDDPSAAAHR